MSPARPNLALLIGAEDGLYVLLPGDAPRRVLEGSVVDIDTHAMRAIVAVAGDGAYTAKERDWKRVFEGDVRRVRFTPDGGMLAGLAPAMVHASEDGTTWAEWTNLQHLLRYHSQRAGTGNHARDVTGIAFASGTVVSVSGLGAFQSLDGGRSWSLHSDGLDRRVRGLWEHAERNDRLYATAPTGFYRSEDGGYTWVQSLAGLDRSFGGDVAVLPGAPDTLLLSASRKEGGEESALFRSVDGGISWERTLLDGQDEWDAPPLVSALTSPIDAFFVFAGGQIWGSHDRGDHWIPMADGLPRAQAFAAGVGAW